MTTGSLFQTYARAPLSFTHGHGSWLIDASGDRYLDFAAGIAVNSLGHAHPHLVEALTRQAEKLWHVSNLYEIPGQETLARRLCEVTFADTVFFTNSGAEAMECAFKTVRRFHYVNNQPERVRIISFEGAFHGRTLATIAAGGQAKYLEGFGPKAAGFDQVPLDDADALTNALGDDVAAIVIEPIQGEGGLNVVSSQRLRQLREICDDTGSLLVFDEIQCGMGRTGKLFAHERAGITPDVMAVAKGIGGGFPVGACLSTREAAKGMTPGTHGSTYGGNPLAMAVANAVLDIVLKPGFLDEVVEKSLLLRQGLAELTDLFPELVEEIRGEGLMLGVKCRRSNADLVAALRTRRMLAVPAGGNVVRLLPPLTVSPDEIKIALEKLSGALQDCRKNAETAEMQKGTT